MKFARSFGCWRGGDDKKFPSNFALSNFFALCYAVTVITQSGHVLRCDSQDHLHCARHTLQPNFDHTVSMLVGHQEGHMVNKNFCTSNSEAPRRGMKD